MLVTLQSSAPTPPSHRPASPGLKWHTVVTACRVFSVERHTLCSMYNFTRCTYVLHCLLHVWCCFTYFVMRMRLHNTLEACTCQNVALIFKCIVGVYPSGSYEHMYVCLHVHAYCRNVFAIYVSFLHLIYCLSNRYCLNWCWAGGCRTIKVNSYVYSISVS